MAKQEAEKIWVVATDRGHDNVALREPGEKFQVPKTWTSPWFRPLKPDEIKAAAADE